MATISKKFTLTGVAYTQKKAKSGQNKTFDWSTDPHMRSYYTTEG